jgi:hypothetical protein
MNRLMQGAKSRRDSGVGALGHGDASGAASAAVSAEAVGNSADGGSPACTRNGVEVGQDRVWDGLTPSHLTT